MTHPSFTPAADGQSYGMSPGAVLWQAALTAYAPLGGEHGSESAKGRGNAHHFMTSMLTAANAAGMSASAILQLQSLAEQAATTNDPRAVRALLTEGV